jgi:predicted NUDIX family NTP pyrophosphohydrolase
MSAGLVMYRWIRGEWEYFLAHPGGPYSRSKDEGHWTIPKGEPQGQEPLLEVAKREFKEETGIEPQGPYVELGCIQQKGGKWVYAWAFEGECHGPICSNTYQMEWPPGSGKMCAFPEVDRAAFFPLSEARKRIKETQVPLLERLSARLDMGA